MYFFFAQAMRYCEILFALVFQISIQKVPVGGLEFLGALLIMGGVGAVVWKSWKARMAGGTALGGTGAPSSVETSAVTPTAVGDSSAVVRVSQAEDATPEAAFTSVIDSAQETSQAAASFAQSPSPSFLPATVHGAVTSADLPPLSLVRTVLRSAQGFIDSLSTAT